VAFALAGGLPAPGDGSSVPAMSIRVARASAAELDLVRAIRRTVFVEEQAVPAELEVDGRDAEAEHFLARVGSLPVATARARSTPKGWKLERVAVLGPQRQLGVGMALVRHLLEQAPAGAVHYVHPQEGAHGVWERAGCVAEGPDGLSRQRGTRRMSLSWRRREKRARGSAHCSGTTGMSTSTSPCPR
jgi:predicted GNAT family N-acyltransferase